MDSGAGRARKARLSLIEGSGAGAHGAVLADTSAWVEYLRGTGSPADAAVRGQLRSGRLATTEPVFMELMSGASGETDAVKLKRMLLNHCETFAVAGLEDYELAARVYRVCRRAGRTLRHQVDCLIAAVAIRNGIPLLHADTDFDFIAQHTPLKIHPA